MNLLHSFHATSDIVMITQLKARYAMFADAKYHSDHRQADPDKLAAAARGQAACFTVDASWDAGPEFGGTLRGRHELECFFRSPPWRYAIHFYTAPLFEEIGELTRVMWRLWQICLPVDSDEPVLLAATTEEDYVKTTKGWLHHHVRFVTLDSLRVPSGQLQSLGLKI